VARDQRTDRRTKAELLEENAGLRQAAEQLRARLEELADVDRLALERDNERELRIELEVDLDRYGRELLEESALRRAFESERDFLRSIVHGLIPESLR
jgi:hypothetical protein